MQMILGGETVKSAATFEVLNPATGEVYAHAPECTAEQLDLAMSAASDAQKTWAADETLRREKLQEFSGAMMDAAPEIAEILAEENGKTLDLGGVEALTGAAWLDYFANFERETVVVRDDDDAHTEVVRRPLGVVSAITPWNVPVAMAFFKIAPALRAGNTIVLKPSPFTPMSSLRVGEIANEILPPGVLNVVTGGDELGAMMTKHPVPRKVSFTGSVAAGKLVYQSAAADLKRVTLELGGNDAAILLDDANPAEIAEALFWGAFFNNGQGCILIKRLYVPESLHAETVEALAEIAKNVVVGDPTAEETQLGSLANDPQLRRVTDLVDRSLSEGATAVTGGKPVEGAGAFYEPTIMTNAWDGMPIVDEEQFGPVLPVIPYQNLEDVVSTVNRGMYGLGGSVWSADPERAEAIATTLEVGTAWVNSHAVLSTDAPFGGVKWSGLGIEHGHWGLDDFSAIQVVHRNKGVSRPGAL
ncbi:aldehyde dehydrogenase family protein [Gordonia sp. KTR9]|uniref:aldehyde dehydrogenase family protein n=1 Tax=Gordonia sp. KTR9 TaxID=337191 RepID=UPI00027DDBB5|nr:aldehyde dehydrogenase family protein [Gordonia sp. KTR9]AFR48168.1 NAD-dependent aldehyde dehydrogenase [Gordonia sp. KTR9]